MSCAGFPTGYRLPEHERMFVAIVHWYLKHPDADEQEVKKLIDWLCPTWYFSNGYFAVDHDEWLADTLIYNERHRIEKLWRRMRFINFWQLFVPAYIQEKVISNDSRTNTVA